MSTCGACARMARPRLLERARVLSVWRGLKSKAPPPARLVRQWKRDGIYPDLLSQETVNKILGTEKGERRPRRKKQRREPVYVEPFEEDVADEDWREHDQGGQAFPSDEEDFLEYQEEFLPVEEVTPLLPRTDTVRRPVSAALGAPSPTEVRLDSELLQALLDSQTKTQATLDLLLEERAQGVGAPGMAASTTPQVADSAPLGSRISTEPQVPLGAGRVPTAGVAASTTPRAVFPTPTAPQVTQLPGESLTDRRLRSLGEFHQWLGLTMGLDPPPTPVVAEDQGIERLGALGTPEVLQRQMEFPLPKAIRDVWDNARQPKKLAETPMAVRQCYRLLPQDWAYLGAIRRPDEALLTYCRGKTKDSSKGPTLLYKDKGLERFDTLCSDIVLESSNTVRPVAMSLTAANQSSLVLSKVREHLVATGAPQSILDATDAAKQCALLAVEGAVDAADCLARQNATALRHLRQSWVEASSLPEHTRKQVLVAPLTGGVPPQDKTRAFAAPLIGDALNTALEQAVDSAKQQVLFQQQSDILRPASSGYKIPKQPGQTKKVQKPRKESPVVAPAKESWSGSPKYGSQGNQGTQAKPKHKSQKQEKKAPKDKASRDQKGRGRGRGKP